MTDLPFPDWCPYNGFCPVKEEVEKQEKRDAVLCRDLNYVSCPAYATQYRSDFMNCLSNAITGAVLKRLSMLEIVIGDNILVEDTEVEGFRETEVETPEEKVLKDLQSKGERRGNI
jgi:hypothetical protein